METEKEKINTDAQSIAEDVNTSVSRKIPAKSGRSFAERMGEAGYLTGRRYDAIKNAFLSYETAGKKPKSVSTRISRSGEIFYKGRKVLAKLCVVGGYLRLFMALDAKAYNADKYHHKDCSGMARYAKTPFMLKISSDRQEKYALELIDDLLKLNGFQRNENYKEKDQAKIFKKPARKKASGETAATYVSVFGTSEAPHADSAGSIDVKLPVNAVVVDKYGERIGKIRKGVWKDADGAEKGTFVKEEKDVFLYSDKKRAAYVDKNYNILSPSNGYIATIRRPSYFIIPIIILLLVFVTLFSVFFSAYFLKRSENVDYAPVLFIASEDGTTWEKSESLPVFLNDTFGDSKIAPGMSGSYRFVFRNENSDKLTYSLGFSEVNEYGISILYRIKRDGAYITEGREYVGVNDLGIDGLTIEAGSETLFELEWLWKDNDEKDTVAGENSAVYTLNITLSARVVV